MLPECQTENIMTFTKYVNNRVHGICKFFFMQLIARRTVLREYILTYILLLFGFLNTLHCTTTTTCT